eukprot:COSAG02_NODE_12187_length_1583_cov_1.321429_2_plen_208_part_00
MLGHLQHHLRHKRRVGLRRQPCARTCNQTGAETHTRELVGASGWVGGCPTPCRHPKLAARSDATHRMARRRHQRRPRPRRPVSVAAVAGRVDRPGSCRRTTWPSGTARKGTVLDRKTVEAQQKGRALLLAPLRPERRVGVPEGRAVPAVPAVQRAREELEVCVHGWSKTQNREPFERGCIGPNAPRFESWTTHRRRSRAGAGRTPPR